LRALNAVRDVAATALVQRASVRSRLEDWLRQYAPHRHDEVRAAAAKEPAELRDAVVAMADAAEELAHQNDAGSSYDASLRSLIDADDRRRALCPHQAPNGRLAPEMIQLVVRTHFDALRRCYEAALMRDPNVQGRVAIKFVIDPSGATTRVSDAGSDLPDAKVIACVADRFRELRFAPPHGGIVTVVYPLIFNPGD
jgi:hypothetical protein